MRVVLDTNILVRANHKAQGPARRLLLSIVKGSHSLIVSPFILAEVERVLAYPRLQAHWHMSSFEIQEYSQFLASVSVVVHPPLGIPVVLADPSDDPLVHTAVAGRAEAICTLDQHIRQPRVVSFLARQGIQVMTDLELLSILGAQQTE